MIDLTASEEIADDARARDRAAARRGAGADRRQFNDFLVFGMMAIGSFSSGQLLANYGWSAVNMVVFPPVLLGLAVLSFVSFAKRRAKLRAVDEFPEPSI